jgi:hypothetical protein
VPNRFWSILSRVRLGIFLDLDTIFCIEVWYQCLLSFSASKLSIRSPVKDSGWY